MTDHQFKKLYEDYCDRLVTVSRLYVRDRMVAEDIVADSFVRLYRAAGSLPADVKLEAYLMTIVKNQSLNYLKSLQTHQRVEGEMGSHQDRMVQAGTRSLSSLDPQQLFASEIQRLVAGAMDTMPQMTRQVFSASRQSGKTYQEIADELGISNRRVHTEMEKALAALRVALKDYLPAWLLVLYLDHLMK